MIRNLDEVVAIVRASEKQDFVRKFPDPALSLWIPELGGNSLSMDETTLQTTMEEEGFKNIFSIIAGRNHIAWLTKSERNFFQNIISLGRAPNNDVQIPVETISKVHAVFMRVGDNWRVSDRGAKNGLFVNNIMVENGINVDLRDGDTLRFGREIEGTFHTPGGLYEFLDRLG